MVFFAADFVGAFSGAESALAAASSGAALAAAFFGLAVRLALAGAFAALALAVDLREAGFLAALVASESATEVPVPLLVAAVLAAASFVEAFFAEVFREVEAAFFALLADLEGLRFPGVLRGFGSGFDCAVASSDSLGDFEAAADSATESAAGA